MTKSPDRLIENEIKKSIKAMCKCRECPIGANTEKGLNLPGQRSIHKIVDDLIFVLFPGCHGHEPMAEKDLGAAITEKFSKAAAGLRVHLKRVFEYQCRTTHESKCKKCNDCGKEAEKVVINVIGSLPKIERILQRDIVAAYEGDPAARSTMEVVMSYPGVYAVIVHRIAHVLYENKVPLIPRVMSEYAHSQTGIDIHPGAQIGPGFFIDHGTGVVIGETCTIGENVKLYQGVTLGALSFEKDENGNPVKGIKRHPDVGDNVVIYAGATILGGNTRIGANSEIGGNVWLTKSVPPGSEVYNQQPGLFVKQKK